MYIIPNRFEEGRPITDKEDPKKLPPVQWNISFVREDGIVYAVFEGKRPVGFVKTVRGTGRQDWFFPIGKEIE